MLERNSRAMTTHPRHIIVGVDSAVGGHDQFAICAQCMVADGEWVVSLFPLVSSFLQKNNDKCQ
jgi:hypothetical protein